MKKSKCPSCKKVIQLEGEMKVQELITCPHCKSLLEIVKLFPPTLDWVEDHSVNSSRRTFINLN